MKRPNKHGTKTTTRQTEKQLRQKCFESAYTQFIRAYINGKLKQAGLAHVRATVTPAPEANTKILMFTVNEKRSEEARVSKIMDDAARVAQSMFVDGVAQLRRNAMRFAEEMRRNAARL